MLVAGEDDTLTLDGARRAFANDFRVVFAALQRSNPNKLELPPGTLDTTSSAIQFLDHNMDRVKKVMAGFSELDLTGISRTQLPVYAMLLMTELRKVILDNTTLLEISPRDIKMLKPLPIEDISIRSSKLSLESFMALQGLPNLTKLDVSENILLSTHTGDDKFGVLTKRLVKLRAAMCDLDSDWLDSILKCTNLEFLDVSENKELFKDRVPTADYSFMKGLTNLHVSKCGLGSDWMDEIFKCTNLESLDISLNRNIGRNHIKLSEFKNLKLLKRLRASMCNLTSKSLSEICKCERLEELDIDNNSLLWEEKVDFGECRSNLVRLNVAGTILNGDVLRSICGPSGWGWLKAKAFSSLFGLNAEDGFSKLASLNMSENGMMGKVMSQKGFSFGNLENTLVELNISYTKSDSYNVIEAIGRCRNLLRLHSRHNIGLLKNDGEINFGYLKSKLEELDIEHMELQPDMLSRIFGLDQLVELNISNNDTACQDLGTCSLSLGGVKDTLTKIDMRKTGLTGEGLKRIFEEFSGLQNVDAKYNELITSADLLGLNFETIANRLVELKVSTDRKTRAEMEKKLPMTMIYHY